VEHTLVACTQTDSSLKQPQIDYLSSAEKMILEELNHARTNPLAFSQRMEEMRKNYTGYVYLQPNGIQIKTQEGIEAFEEAMEYMKNQSPIGPLQPSWGLSLLAQDHCAEQSKTGRTGHASLDGSDFSDRVDRYGTFQVTCGENLSYGSESAFDNVTGLIIDDGVPTRGHRRNIFTSDFHVVGIAYGSHKDVRSVCVMDFAGGYIDDQAKIQARSQKFIQDYEKARREGYQDGGGHQYQQQQVHREVKVTCFCDIS